MRVGRLCELPWDGKLSRSPAYSNLAKLPGGRVGLLFERDGYKKFSFVPFSIEWLEGMSGTP